MLKTIGFPGRYVQGEGALSSLGRILREMGLARPLAIIDPVVGKHLWPKVAASLSGQDLQAAMLEFPGECTREVIAQLASEAKQCCPGVIVALGGGKTIDTAKGVARALRLPVVVCPTIASSDAPTSRLIVLYDSLHKVVGGDYLDRNPDAVIVDTAVIAQAPARFFAAGVGDAISKKFEAEQCDRAQGANSFGTRPLNTALLLARTTYDVLQCSAINAYHSVGQGIVTSDVEDVVEATVLLSGVGFESGGLSLAHALVRGLTAIPEMAGKLHGEIVAFGTIVQMLADGRSDGEIKDLIKLLAALNLPITLKDLGQEKPLLDEQIAIIVMATLTTNYSKNMLPPLTAASLEQCLIQADRVGTQWYFSSQWAT
jgi:glycerol dehydrogenase